jgi:eukaryotic-like serine/threonine-protein kinase
MGIRAAVSMMFPIGTILRDRYVVEELLGKGGFGAVYLVRDLRVRQNQFALKELIDSSKLERERFTFEGEVLKRVDHPALPRIYRVFDDDKSGRAYILMDYIEGSNLEVLRHQQPEKHSSLSRVLFLMAPIIDAVSYLHHQNPPIIHRDIKPANIIVPRASEGTVLVDFGIAKEYDPDSTTTAVRRASPGYGAPEQYTRGTNTRTDIYGLGATIYALLTGLIPADAFHRMAQLGSTGVDPLEPVNHLVPSISQPVSEAISRAMAMHSQDRFPTVEEFWQALNAFPLNAYPAEQQRLVPIIGPSTPVPASVSAKDTTDGAYQQEQPRRSSKLGLLLLLLAALLIGAGVAAGFFVYTSSHRTANVPTPTATHHPSAAPTTKPTQHPKVTPTPPPTIASTPTSVPPAFPVVVGVHNGTIHNTTGGLTATMSLSIQQNSGTINGNFRVNSPLQGSGPFTGSVTTTDRIQFIVHSSQVTAPLYFWGTVQTDGSMQGNYCSLDRTNHCNPNAGGAGYWNAGPASAPSSSTPGNDLLVIDTGRQYGARYGA